jgi:hypothetical protein
MPYALMANNRYEAACIAILLVEYFASVVTGVTPSAVIDAAVDVLREPGAVCRLRRRRRRTASPAPLQAAKREVGGGVGDVAVGVGGCGAAGCCGAARQQCRDARRSRMNSKSGEPSRAMYPAFQLPLCESESTQGRSSTPYCQVEC